MSLYLPPWGMGVFWLQAGRGRLSTYHRGDGVFWLQEGRGCLSTYHRGGWSFLIAGRAKVSLYLPPRGREFFGCRQGEGVSLPTDEGMGVF